MMQSPSSMAASGTWLVCLLAVLLAVGCSDPPTVQLHAAGAYPERLSDWGLLQRRGDRLVLGDDVHPYEINTPLFSDYALKLRTWYLPSGAAMTYRDSGSFDFPVGSVITKTFFYPAEGDVMQAAAGWNGDVAGLDLRRHRLIETRLLVRQPDGWQALPYVWRGDDAYLKITGELVPIALDVAGDIAKLPYLVPARSECASCHATDHGDGTLQLIGLKARHLNRAYPGQARNQLDAWAGRGRLSGLPAADSVPASAAWDDASVPLAERARSYLDSNCGHCHSATGAADTSGLLLDASVRRYRDLGVCKPPIAAGRGTGGRPYSIVPGQPDQSILVYRLETDDPATRMPEIGRAVMHREGVALIRDWVASLPGRCI